MMFSTFQHRSRAPVPPVSSAFSSQEEVKRGYGFQRFFKSIDRKLARLSHKRAARKRSNSHGTRRKHVRMAHKARNKLRRLFRHSSDCSDSESESEYEEEPRWTPPASAQRSPLRSPIRSPISCAGKGNLSTQHESTVPSIRAPTPLAPVDTPAVQAETVRVSTPEASMQDHQAPCEPADTPVPVRDDAIGAKVGEAYFNQSPDQKLSLSDLLTVVKYEKCAVPPGSAQSPAKLSILTKLSARPATAPAASEEEIWEEKLEHMRKTAPQFHDGEFAGLWFSAKKLDLVTTEEMFSGFDENITTDSEYVSDGEPFVVDFPADFPIPVVHFTQDAEAPEPAELELPVNVATESPVQTPVEATIEPPIQTPVESFEATIEPPVEFSESVEPETDTKSIQSAQPDEPEGEPLSLRTALRAIYPEEPVSTLAEDLKQGAISEAEILQKIQLLTLNQWTQGAAAPLASPPGSSARPASPTPSRGSSDAGVPFLQFTPRRKVAATRREQISRTLSSFKTLEKEIGATEGPDTDPALLLTREYQLKKATDLFKALYNSLFAEVVEEGETVKQFQTSLAAVLQQGGSALLEREARFGVVDKLQTLVASRTPLTGENILKTVVSPEELADYASYVRRKQKQLEYEVVEVDNLAAFATISNKHNENSEGLGMKRSSCGDCDAESEAGSEPVDDEAGCPPTTRRAHFSESVAVVERDVANKIEDDSTPYLLLVRGHQILKQTVPHTLRQACQPVVEPAELHSAMKVGQNPNRFSEQCRLHVRTAGPKTVRLVLDLLKSRPSHEAHLKAVKKQAPTAEIKRAAQTACLLEKQHKIAVRECKKAQIAAYLAEERVEQLTEKVDQLDTDVRGDHRGSTALVRKYKRAKRMLQQAEERLSDANQDTLHKLDAVVKAKMVAKQQRQMVASLRI